MSRMSGYVEMTKKVDSTIYNTSTFQEEKRKDSIAIEKPLHLFLNEFHYATILCSPNYLKEFVVGHLLSEGILKGENEIQNLRLREDGRCIVKTSSKVDVKMRISMARPFARVITSECGPQNLWPITKLIDKLDLPAVSHTITVDAKTISQSIKNLNSAARVYRETGGVHVAALHSINGELLVLAEDVGRHNAIDKIIGFGILGKHDFKKCFIASSGRLSGDIILKSARMGIPLVASISAPLNSGIEVARETGVTLVGFVRGNRMRIFSGICRIELSSAMNKSTSKVINL